jgi:hypothetical protein
MENNHSSSAITRNNENEVAYFMNKLLSADASRRQADVDDEVAAKLVERAGKGAGTSRVMQYPFFCVLVVWR